MGVDHGLGGRDNKKSRQRREKKAKRVKAIAIKALHSGTKKKEVVFDEAARTEWLTGFHKRKQERRKFGLAMQIIKDKKQHKDAIREQRSTLQAASQYDRNNNKQSKKDDEDEEEKEEDDGFDYDYMGEDPTSAADAAAAAAAVVVAGKTVFTDERTQSMFGGAVTVVVDTGVADELFEQNNPDLPEQGMGHVNHKLAREKKVLNKLEKAMKQVDRLGKMNKKKKSNSALEEGGGGGKGGFNKKQKQNGKLLYHKALGSGALPGRTYKGNKKGKRAG